MSASNLTEVVDELKKLEVQAETVANGIKDVVAKLEVSPTPEPDPGPTPVPEAVPNTMSITNKSGTVVSNYPLQFGRAFNQGVIPNFPQVVAHGTTLLTQADVKNRYQDGSVKFAVISVMIPSLPATGTIELSFKNQSSGNNQGLSKEQMLDLSYDFDAYMTLTNGDVTKSVSARQMLESGHYKIWTQGSVAQTIELADDSKSRTYDIGFDAYEPFRPRFHATFWPQTKQVHVRFVGENSNSQEIEHISYNLTLSLGEKSPTEVYSIALDGSVQPAKHHWAMTHWTKQFWINGQPEKKVNIDHNLKYLTQSRFIPNFDTRITIQESAIAALYANWWTKFKNDLYDGSWNRGSVWQSAMATAGGRPEIAPIPQWHMFWLYTGDYRMRELALGITDIAAAVPAHIRENEPTKNLLRRDLPGAGTGLGHTISTTDRRTIAIHRPDMLNYTYSKPEHRVVTVGPYMGAPWTLDGAHQSAAFYVPYLLTGDAYYLHEMYFWAGYSACRYNGANFSVPGRGPTGLEGGINDELRGGGWVLRNRAELAFIAPDDHPEKIYFTILTNEALARWEGSFGITDTQAVGSVMYEWGKKTGNFYSNNGGPNALKFPLLHNWEANGNPKTPSATITNNENNGIFKVGAVGNFTSPWMQYYTLYAIGRTAELGFPAEAILKKSATWLIGMINDSGNPGLLAVYQIPVEKRGGGFMNWSELIASLTDQEVTRLANILTKPFQNEAYAVYAGPALSFMTKEPGGEKAWAWYKANVYDKVANFNLNPRWAILPRANYDLTPPSRSS